MKIPGFLESFSLVFKDLVQDSWRSLFTIANLAVFIACFFCLTALSEAGFKFGDQSPDQTSLMVLAKNVFDPTDSQISAAEFAPIQKLIPSEVKSVSPLILKHMNINDFMLQVRATYPQDFESVHSLSLIKGKWPLEKNEVAIGEGTVNLTHWTVGKIIHIFGEDFTITGIVRAPGTKFGSVWMTIENAEALFGTKGIYQFAWVVVAPGANAEQVKKDLQNAPGISGKFDVYFVDQLYQQYNQALSDVKGISQMLEFLALLCVMFGAYGSTYLTLSERDRDLTVLRAVGFDSIHIRLILSIRTLLQVFFAFLTGWGIAQIAIYFFEKTSPIMVHSIPLPVAISFQSIGIGFCLSVLFALLGVWLPTRHLRKTSVAEMIRR